MIKIFFSRILFISRTNLYKKWIPIIFFLINIQNLAPKINFFHYFIKIFNIFTSSRYLQVPVAQFANNFYPCFLYLKTYLFSFLIDFSSINLIIIYSLHFFSHLYSILLHHPKKIKFTFILFGNISEYKIYI